MVLAFDPVLVPEDQSGSKAAIELQDELAQALKNNNIKLSVLDVSTGEAKTRKAIEKLCLDSKGNYLPLARGDEKELAIKMGEIGVK
jgi:Mg-chelatase subunit ChlD